MCVCVCHSLSLFCPSTPSDSFSGNQSNRSLSLGVMTSFVLHSNHMERCHLEAADSAQHIQKCSRAPQYWSLGSNSSALCLQTAEEKGALILNNMKDQFAQSLKKSFCALLLPTDLWLRLSSRDGDIKVHQQTQTWTQHLGLSTQQMTDLSEN